MAIVSTVGCSTHVSVKKIDPNKSSIISGPVIALKKSEYHLDIARELQACEFKDGKLATTTENSFKPGDSLPLNGNINFKVKTTFTLKQELMTDPNKMFYVDYSSDGLSTKALESEYYFHEDGSLKSLNSTIDDKTAEVISGVVAAASTLALANVGMNLNMVPAISATHKTYTMLSLKDESKKLTLCTDKIQKNLAKKVEVEKDFSKKKGALITVIANINKTAKKLAEVKESKEEGRLDTALKGYRTQLVTAVAEFNATEAVLSKITKSLTSHEHYYLSRAETASDNWNNKHIIANDQYFKPWLNPDFVKKAPSVIPLIQKTLAHYVAFENMGAAEDVIKSTDDVGGVIYQVPTKGVIRVCKRTSCSLDNANRNIVLYKTFDVPDSGYYGKLQLNSGAFEDSTIEAEFSKTGRMTRYKVLKNATAEAATNSVKDLADQIKGYKDSKNNRPKDDLTSTNELLQLQVDNLELQAALKKLQESEQGSEPAQ